MPTGIKVQIRCLTCKKLKLPTDYDTNSFGKIKPNCRQCIEDELFRIAYDESVVDIIRQRYHSLRHSRRKRNSGKRHSRIATFSEFRKLFPPYLQCGYCGLKINTLDQCHVDHIVPVSSGGTDLVENLMVACTFCNRAKSNHTVDEFIYWLRWVKRSKYIK